MGRAPRITTRCTKLQPDAPNYNQGPSHHENKSLIMHCRSFQTLPIRTENPYSVPVQVPDDIGLQFGASGLTKQGWWPITFVCLTNGWGPSSLPPTKKTGPGPTLRTRVFVTRRAAKGHTFLFSFFSRRMGSGELRTQNMWPKSIRMIMNGVSMARHGPIFGQNEPYRLQEVF